MKAQEIVDLLNEANQLDTHALWQLIEGRVKCNNALADHATITCYPDPCDQGMNLIGMLGFLNGLVDHSKERIVMHANDGLGLIERFEVATPETCPLYFNKL